MFSPLRFLQQTRATTNMMNMALVGMIVLLISIGTAQCRVCTRIRSEKRLKTQMYHTTCHQTYEARCGWFSLKQCTFNETIPCMKEHNQTVTVYRIVEDCCPGYGRNKDGKCVRDSEVEISSKQMDHKANYTTDTPGLEDFVTGAFNDTVQQGGGQGAVDNGRKNEGVPEQRGVKDDLTVAYHSAKVTSGPEAGSHNSHHDNHGEDDGLFWGISHGAYAGIVCGILFVACVALLTALHYRKRQLRKAKMSSVTAEQEAAQKRQMIPLEKRDNSVATA